MQSVVKQHNDAYLQQFRARIAQYPLAMLEAAAEAAFTAAVEGTRQDSGEAAASWNLSLTSSPSELRTAMEGELGVGLRGEARTDRGNAGIVVAAKLQQLEAELPDLMDGKPVVLFLGNPVFGVHAVNANLLDAEGYAELEAVSAAAAVVDRLNRV